MAIRELQRVLPPPKFPEDVGENVDWGAVEAELRCELPRDYKDLVESYGSGVFDGFVWVLNPFSSNSNLELRSQMDVRLRALESLERDFGEKVPFPLYPEIGGLIPWAFTDNGDVLYWIVDGNADDWSIVVNASRESDWQEFRLTCSSFLAGLFTRELVVDIFPEDIPSDAPAFTPLSDL